MHDARAFWRTFFIGGIIAYRALFNWLKPAIYIPSMLGAPIFQILFFVYLGRFTGVRNDAFFIIGNAVQVSAMSAIYAMTMCIANERSFGTLSALLATPANRLAIFLGRGLPVLLSGLFVSAFSFTVGSLLLGFRVPLSVLPVLVITVVITAASCTALGMVLGSIGMRARDVFFSANLAYFLMLLFCGINVPLGSLPGWMQVVGNGVPMTHGIAAARMIAASGPGAAAVAELLREAVIGLTYGAVAYGLFRFFEEQGRRLGVFDRI
ncbi:MAG: ABC transporter permease [Candidatus Dormibacteria bacterium]